MIVSDSRSSPGLIPVVTLGRYLGISFSTGVLPVFFTQHFVVLLSTIVLCFDSHFIFFLPWSFFRKGRLQPWGYLYGLIWPSHTETIHSHLLLSSVTRVPLSKRETQRDVNRLERCIVHLQDECKLSLICEYMRHSHSVKTCSPLGHDSLVATLLGP
jgi:hypothetical protein